MCISTTPCDGRGNDAARGPLQRSVGKTQDVLLFYLYFYFCCSVVSCWLELSRRDYQVLCWRSFALHLVRTGSLQLAAYDLVHCSPTWSQAGRWYRAGLTASLGYRRKATATVHGRSVVPDTRHGFLILAGRAQRELHYKDHISRIIAKQSGGPCLGSFVWLADATERDVEATVWPCRHRSPSCQPPPRSRGVVYCSHLTCINRNLVIVPCWLSGGIVWVWAAGYPVCSGRTSCRYQNTLLNGRFRTAGCSRQTMPEPT